MLRDACRTCVWVVASLLVIGVGTTGHAAKWDPVDPAELAMAKPTVEADADAEVLAWDARVADVRRGEDFETVYEHHLRIKIFTDRGRDAQSRVDIPHASNVRVWDIQGRTVKRDGSTVELKDADIFERDLVKVSGVKVKATSFVLPGAETGGLVEYRWRETHQDTISFNLRLPFSREIPVRVVRYRLTPLSLGGTEFVMRASPFRCSPEPLKREGPATYLTSLTNVPAYREEPRAPSEWDLRPWLLIYYDLRATENVPKAFWGQWSRDTYKGFRKTLAPTSSTERAVGGLVKNGAPVNDAIAAALGFCRSKIKRMDLDTTAEAERKGFKGNKNVQDALSGGRGTGDDVLGSFIAIMRAMGYDARLVYTPRRDDVGFDPAMMLPQLMTDQIAAVKDGETWRFVDPANAYAPTGELRWQYEGHQVLVPDEKELLVVKMPTAPPEWTTRHRKATLTLADDGTLEGEMTAEATGHLGQSFKHTDDGLAPAEREKALTESMTSYLPGAELSKIVVENVTDPSKPYTYRFHIRVPGFAQRAGSRLFVVPAVFQKGRPAEFTAEKRQSPLLFNFAWREIDEIDIVVPAGFTIDGNAQPGATGVPGVSTYAATITPSADGTSLKYRREMVFGTNARLSFEAASYVTFRSYFNDIVKRDGFAVTLRRAQGGAQRP